MTHYIDFGASEGRDPNAFFDSDWYLAKYGDVAKSGMNPLDHYIRFGAAEGRDPSPMFDTDWYVANNPDELQSRSFTSLRYSNRKAGARALRLLRFHALKRG